MVCHSHLSTSFCSHRRTGYGRTGSSGGGGAPIDPDLKLWLVGGEGMYQERTGASATTASGVGDPVGTWVSQSDLHYAVAPTDARRVTRRAAVDGRNCAQSDGTDDSLAVAYHADLKPSSIYSFAAWIRPAVVSPDATRCFAGYLSSSGAYSSGWMLSQYSTTLNVYWRSAGERLVLTNVFLADTWVHLALVRNGTSLEVFKNGVSIGSSSSAVDVTAELDTRIVSTDSAWAWGGHIDDVRVYQKALSLEEIEVLAGIA
jgi:hypothetical protein